MRKLGRSLLGVVVYLGIVVVGTFVLSFLFHLAAVFTKTVPR